MVALLHCEQPGHAGPSRARRSDGMGEFGERGRKPQPRVGVDGEFVVAAADVLNQSVPGADRLNRAQPFRTVHRP